MNTHILIPNKKEYFKTSAGIKKYLVTCSWQNKNKFASINNNMPRTIKIRFLLDVLSIRPNLDSGIFVAFTW